MPWHTPSLTPSQLLWGGGPYGIVDDLYLRLVNLLGLGDPVPPFRSGHIISYMDGRLLERLGVDMRYCWPGFDISHAMPGSREEVIAEARRRIAQLAPGGGYFLAPSNHLQTDLPPENVVALFQSARKIGKYPIDVTGSM